MSGALPVQQFHAVFIASREAMHRFLTRYLGCPDSASDLLQDLYLRLERTPSVSDAAQARAWLFRVAVNLARDHEKVRRRCNALLETARYTQDSDFHELSVLHGPPKIVWLN